MAEEEDIKPRNTEEIDDERLIASSPRISSNQDLKEKKGKIILIVLGFLFFMIALVVILVFIFKADSSNHEDKKDDDKIIVKENIIRLKYEIKNIDKKTLLINNNFLKNISYMIIQNSNQTLNITDPVDEYQFEIEDNYTIEIKFNNNLTNINNIFKDCTSLKEVNFSELNTFYIEEMEYVFYGCNSLTDIFFGDINTSKVISMKNMFSYCS